MRPSLYLLKKQNGRTEVTMKTKVHVVVIDLDGSKRYPLNFICICPQTAISLENTPFSAISLEIAAWKLLENSFKEL